MSPGSRMCRRIAMAARGCSAAIRPPASASRAHRSPRRQGTATASSHRRRRNGRASTSTIRCRCCATGRSAMRFFAGHVLYGDTHHLTRFGADQVGADMAARLRGWPPPALTRAFLPRRKIFDFALFPTHFPGLFSAPILTGRRVVPRNIATETVIKDAEPLDEAIMLGARARHAVRVHLVPDRGRISAAAWRRWSAAPWSRPRSRRSRRWSSPISSTRSPPRCGAMAASPRCGPWIVWLAAIWFGGAPRLPRL